MWHGTGAARCTARGRREGGGCCLLLRARRAMGHTPRATLPTACHGSLQHGASCGSTAPAREEAVRSAAVDVIVRVKAERPRVARGGRVARLEGAPFPTRVNPCSLALPVCLGISSRGAQRRQRGLYSSTLALLFFFHNPRFSSASRVCVCLCVPESGRALRASVEPFPMMSRVHTHTHTASQHHRRRGPQEQRFPRPPSVLHRSRFKKHKSTSPLTPATSCPPRTRSVHIHTHTHAHRGTNAFKLCGSSLNIYRVYSDVCALASLSSSNNGCARVSHPSPDAHTHTL